MTWLDKDLPPRCGQSSFALSISTTAPASNGLKTRLPHRYIFNPYESRTRIKVGRVQDLEGVCNCLAAPMWWMRLWWKHYHGNLNSWSGQTVQTQSSTVHIALPVIEGNNQTPHAGVPICTVNVDQAPSFPSLGGIVSTSDSSSRTKP